MRTNLTILSLCVCFIAACSKPSPAPEADAPSAEKSTPAEQPVAKKAAKPTPAPAPAPKVSKRVFFVSPADQAEVTNPVKLVFGVEGMGIRPAGQDATDKTTGHHHLIIDSEAVPAGAPVPMVKGKYIHYGKGQTETEVTLEPGEHTLSLQFADGGHISYGPEMSATIKVKVSK